MSNEHNIDSQFNACMHKEYCLSLKAGQIRPLDENALAHAINMMPWRTDELGPKLREFAAQLWLQFCSVQAAATAAPSQPVACGLCQGSGVLSPTQKCICQYGGKEPVTLTDEEIDNCLYRSNSYRHFATLVIAALREKEQAK